MKLFFLLICIFAVNIVQSATAFTPWHQNSDRKKFWSLKWMDSFDKNTGKYYLTPVFYCPPQTASTAPAKYEISKTITVQAKSLRLKFDFNDSYGNTGNKGYHFACIYANGQKLWEQDISGDNNGLHTVTIPAKLIKNNKLTITFSAENRKDVTNFPVKLSFRSASIENGNKTVNLFQSRNADDFKNIPETAMDKINVRGLDWTPDLICIQAWEQAAYNLIKYPEKMSKFLKEKLKANAVCLPTPNVFNGPKNGKAAKGHIHTPLKDYNFSKEEFVKALKIYRAAGFKIILYTSIIHVGHAPEWDSGKLQDEHPDWLQVDSSGNYVTYFGGKWLCPNSGALQYAVDYSKKLIAEYHPDALMFDNCFFHYTTSGQIKKPTCYCVNCRDKFRSYLKNRFGDQCKALFKQPAEKIEIPDEEGLLMNVWKSWRTTAWEQALRYVRQNIDLVIFGNTEFMWRDWVLGTDRIYYAEDAIFSESVNTKRLPEKMCLANAFSTKKPVFNFLGTYVYKDQKFWEQKSLPVIAEMLGTTLAYDSNLWLMFHGWDPECGYPEPIGERNAEAHALIQKIFQFRANHKSLYKLPMASDFAVVVASRNRMYNDGAAVPEILSRLINKNIACRAIYDLNLATQNLNEFSVIVAEDLEYVSDLEAENIAKWIKKGGTLIASPNLGGKDQFGQIRPESVILAKLKKEGRGKGKIIFANDRNDIVEKASSLARWKFTTNTGKVSSGFVPYLDAGQKRYVLHITNHQSMPQKTAQVISIPDALRRVKIKHIKLYSPFIDGEQQVKFDSKRIYLPETLPYVVLEISY